MNSFLTSVIELLQRVPMIYLAGVIYSAAILSWMKLYVNEHKAYSEWFYICVIIINGFIPTLISLHETYILERINPTIIIILTPLLLILEFSVITRDTVKTYVFLACMVLLILSCTFGISAHFVTSIVNAYNIDVNVRTCVITLMLILITLFIVVISFFSRNHNDIINVIIHDKTLGSLPFVYMVLNGIVLSFTISLDYKVYFFDEYNYSIKLATISGMTLRYILILATAIIVVYIQCREAISKEEVRQLSDDISKLEDSKKGLEKATLSDSLTGLFNRVGIEKQINHYITNTPPDSNKQYAFFMMDLDNFKSINDRYGHPQGDILLKKTATSILSVFRDIDIVGRLGGDEFCVFMTGGCNRETVEKKAKLLNEILKTHFDLPTGEIANTSVSIGISLFPNNATTYEELYKAADDALYESKKAGRNCYRFA